MGAGNRYEKWSGLGLDVNILYFQLFKHYPRCPLQYPQWMSCILLGVTGEGIYQVEFFQCTNWYQKLSSLLKTSSFIIFWEHLNCYIPCQVGLVVSVSVSQTVVMGSRPCRVILKTIINMVNKLPPCMAWNTLGLDIGSAAWLSKRPGMCGTIYGFNPGINHKSKVLCPGPGFLFCASMHSYTLGHHEMDISRFCQTFTIVYEYMG